MREIDTMQAKETADYCGFWPNITLVTVVTLITNVTGGMRGVTNQNLSISGGNLRYCRPLIPVCYSYNTHTPCRDKRVPFRGAGGDKYA